MRACRRVAALALFTALAAATHARPEHDFEFDDAPDAPAPALESRHPRRYIYDPQNELCHALLCNKREVCLMRDPFTALCANKRDVLRRGDMIVTGSSGPWERSGAAAERSGADDEDVFYESRAPARGSPAPADPPARTDIDRCVGCSGASRSTFLCGSDNRTYSSLCRLDLHNCVHRPRPPVRLACAGFCPCAPPSGAEGQPRRRLRPSRPDRPHRAHSRLDEERRRRRPEPRGNDVLPPRRPRPPRPPAHEVEGCALDKMANRLLDWFSVLMEQAGGTPPPEHGYGAECKPEVRWMFEHLDAAGDGLLQPADLYALSHDERERCLRPFLASCGAGGGGVSRAAWCACLGGAARPCAALARAAAARGARAARGAYVPACDARGFYRPRQCHAALAVCWCVDAHGQERPGSRTKGAPHCLGEEGEAGEAGEAAEGAPADDEDAAGSGDREAELRF